MHTVNVGSARNVGVIPRPWRSFPQRWIHNKCWMISHCWGNFKLLGWRCSECFARSKKYFWVYVCACLFYVLAALAKWVHIVAIFIEAFISIYNKIENIQHHHYVVQSGFLLLSPPVAVIASAANRSDATIPSSSRIWLSFFVQIALIYFPSTRLSVAGRLSLCSEPHHSRQDIWQCERKTQIIKTLILCSHFSIPSIYCSIGAVHPVALFAHSVGGSAFASWLRILKLTINGVDFSMWWAHAQNQQRCHCTKIFH